MSNFFHRVFRLVIVFLVGLVVGVWLSPRHKTISTHTTVDTTIYYRPMPTTSQIAEVRTISLPRLLFAPADTVRETTVILKGDSLQHSLQHSLQLQVPIERREYSDSTYYAVVSGAVVCNIRPTLESIQTYNRNTVQTIEVHPPKVQPYVSAMLGKDAIGAGAGIYFGNNGFGADYIYWQKQHLIMGRYTRRIQWRR